MSANTPSDLPVVSDRLAKNAMRHASERIIEMLLFAAAAVSVLTTVGIVYVNQPSTNTTYNIALPAPATGHPIIYVRFSGAIAAARTVYVTNTANLSTANPTDYYGLWGASAAAVT